MFADASAQSVSVDPLTGSPRISIPLGTISEGDLNASISVVYSGGGVRVEESEGSAGMGWNLVADGVVARELRGLPDDYRGMGSDTRLGWLYGPAATIEHFVPSADESPNTCNDEVADFDFIRAFGYTRDPEPDIFHVSAPGLSLQFVFDATGTPRTVPYQDIKLEVARTNTTGPIDKISITTNVGIQYVFDLKEVVTRKAYQAWRTSFVPQLYTSWAQFQQAVSFTSLWKLTSITSPSGARLEFAYDEDVSSASETPVKVIYPSGQEQELYRIKEEGSAWRLAAVRSESVTAEFEWDQDRISEVLFHSNGSDSIRYGFAYSGVRDFRETGSTTLIRAFLKTLTRHGQCASFPPYEFQYKRVTNWSTLLPFEDRNLQDLWGYYNHSSLTKVPDIYYYPEQSDAERLRLKPLPGATAAITLAGSSRDANPDYFDTGSLYQISYPTGATEIIDYEPNSFFDEAAGDSVQGAGLRVKRVSVSPGEGFEAIERRYSYRLANGMTSGRQLYRPTFAFGTRDSIYRSPDNLAPDGGVLYSRTTERMPGKGWTVYEFKNPGMYPAVNAPPDWTATRTRLARRECQNWGFAQAGFYSYPFAPNSNFDFERGLLDKVSDYDESGVMVRERSFGYGRLGTSPVRIKALRFQGLDDGLYAYSLYSITADVANVVASETTRLADEVTPSKVIDISTTYSYNTAHMLESVSTSNSDGTTMRIRYRYAKDFDVTHPDPARPEAVAIKSLNDNYRHGQVLETITYRKGPDDDESVIGASLKLYNDFGGRTLPHISMEFPFVTGFEETNVSGYPQKLVIDSDYLAADTIRSVNEVGMPISMADRRKNKSGVHYGMENSGVMATVAHAFAEETVFEGFEGSPGHMDVIGGETTLVSAWTGEKARRISSSTTLIKHNIQKGSSRYRFSCWIRSVGHPHITARARYVSQVVSLELEYSGEGQWQYLEGVMDMTSLNNGFSLEVLASAVADLDDIRFLPVQASMSTRTFRPLIGPTSVSDDRGVSAFWDYDALGRLRYTRDREKNVVQVDDYRFKNETATPLKSNFGDDVPLAGLVTGSAVHFDAPRNCVGSSHLWEVNGLPISSSPDLNLEFEEPGLHVIKHRTIWEGDTVATTKTYCVKPNPAAVTFQLTTTSQTLYRCEANTMRIVTVSGLTFCPNEADLTFQWYYKPGSDTFWYAIADQDNSVAFDIATAHGLQSYTLKCVVSGSCGIYDSPDPDCNDTIGFTVERTIYFSYQDNRPCL